MKLRPRKRKLLVPAVALAAAVIIIIFLVPVSSTLPDGLQTVLERFGLRRAEPGSPGGFGGSKYSSQSKTLLGFAGIASMFMPCVVWRILNRRRSRDKAISSLPED